MTIYVLLAIAAMGVAAGLLFWWLARRRDETTHAPPPLIYPLPASPPRPHVNGNGVHRNGANGKHAPRHVDSPVFRPVAVEPQKTNHRTSARLRDFEGDDDDAKTVRFVRPNDDRPVQLLPGRLEVVEGTTSHREIRFVRIPGEPAHVILGREGGLTPHYVGLESPTVSRQHARFDFADNRWVVKNLSRTNPLVVNDDELFDTDAARPLADGDRLELGEVVLRFHAH